MKDPIIIAAGMQFPESPFWSERDGCLYLVDWKDDGILRLRSGRLETLFQTGGGGPSGLCQDPDGCFWICLYDKRVVAQFSQQGEFLREVSSFDGAPFRGPCDLTISSENVVYFTDSGDFEEDWRTGRPAGAVYALDLQGNLVQLDRNLCFPNGIAISPGCQTLYVNEHRKNRTLAYELSDSKVTSGKSVIHSFDERCLLPLDSAFELGPDGMCTLDNGDLWVAHYGGGKLVRLNPSGELQEKLLLPRGRLPTNVAFNLSENALYITEAEFGTIFFQEFN